MHRIKEFFSLSRSPREADICFSFINAEMTFWILFDFPSPSETEILVKASDNGCAVFKHDCRIEAISAVWRDGFSLISCERRISCSMWIFCFRMRSGVSWTFQYSSLKNRTILSLCSISWEAAATTPRIETGSNMLMCVASPMLHLGLRSNQIESKVVRVRFVRTKYPSKIVRFVRTYSGLVKKTNSNDLKRGDYAWNGRS